MPTCRTLPPLLGLILLGACGDRADDTGHGGAPGDAGHGGQTDGGSEPAVESDCEDGADDDGDGAIDCEDSDCADHWSCNLPDSIRYDTVIDFWGNTITCELVGIEYDVEIGDCHTVGGGPLSRIEDPQQTCADCDRTYQGPLTYTQDTCSSKLGQPLPSTATLGLVFLNETQRELFAPDDQWNWYSLGILELVDGVYTLSTSEDIIIDPEGCDNGKQNIGTIDLRVDIEDR
ncbi:MAG: hypothetical protein D6798_13720 [Deltaproteobacteria bacterium]|nr:MAG: hypothetical protein D6798_13720 [Deltaproteobacteria bacterium]